MADFRVMTYNMLHAPGDRLGPLVDVVRSANPDVLACQEVNTFDGMMDLAKELNMMPVWGPANSEEDYRDEKPLYEHLVVLTRLPVMAMRVHRGDREAMFRPVLEVRLKIPGWQEITLFTVHFRALVHPNQRFLKFREVASFLSAVEEARGPVIAMGDFNAWAPGEGDLSPVHAGDAPEDHVAAIQGGVIGAIQSAGLVDSYRLIHPYEGTPVSTLLNRTSSRVDYVFVSPDLTPFVSDSSIVDNHIVQQASDHRPVVTEFTWR